MSTSRAHRCAAVLALGLLALAESGSAPAETPRTFVGAPPGSWGCTVDIEQHEGAMVSAKLAKSCGDQDRDRTVMQLLRNSEPVFEAFGQVSGPVYLLMRLKPCERCAKAPARVSTAPEDPMPDAASAARQQWRERIAHRVQQAWKPVEGVSEGQRFRCVVELEQAPGGEVLRATVVSSCGSPLLDRSVENAALGASPLPSPGDATPFEPVVTFPFERS